MVDDYRNIENSRGFVARNVFLKREEYPLLNKEQEQELAKIIQGTTQSLYEVLIDESTFHCAVEVLKESMNDAYPDEYLHNYFGSKAIDTIKRVYQDFDPKRTGGKLVIESLRDKLRSYLEKFNALSKDENGFVDKQELAKTEQELAIKFSELSDLLSRVNYNQENDQCHVISRKEDIAQAKDILFHSNLGLVSSEVNKFYILKNCEVKGVKYEDLFQEGSLGLMKAVNKFKPGREKFSTYAGWWIRAEMKAYFVEIANGIHIPNYMIGKINRMNSEITTLANQLGRLPTNEEIAPGIDETVEVVEEIKEYAKLLKIQSIHEKVSSDGDPLIDLIPGEDNDPDKELKQRQLVTKFDEALSEVTPRERYILEEHYFKGRTLEDIGIDLEMTKEGIRQIEIKAMRKLRHPDRAGKLRDFL